MNPKIIVIDGKTYNSVDEMPEDIRQKYEQAMSSLKEANGNLVPDAFEIMNLLADKNKNGVPDVLEGIGSLNVASNMKIIVDGKKYDSVESLPPELRAKYEQALGAIDANRNGIPDFLEGKIEVPKTTIKVSTNFKLQTPHLSKPSVAATPSASIDDAQDQSMPVASTITPDTSNGWMLALLGLALLVLCSLGAAGIWYFFLR